MNKKSKVSLIFFLVIIILSIIGYHYSLKAKGNVAGTKTEDKIVQGSILPHHNLAHSIISESYQKLSQSSQYSLVVIFSPNHFHPEAAPIITSQYVNDTPVNEDLVNQLINKFSFIESDKNLVENEHGIMLQVPYIKQYFPGAKIVPLIFSPVYNSQEIEDISNFLSQNLPPSTLYLASIDFSHESTVEEGLSKNDETIEALKNFDYKTIYNFKNDHMDGPTAAVAFLKSLQKVNSLKWETWHSTHGGLIENDPTIRGTSYVIGIFYK